MALSKDDRARLIKSGKLARTALAAAHMGTRMTPHSGEDAAPSEVSLPGDITEYLRGALLVEDAGDGLVQPYRFSEKQLRYLDSVGRGRRARATSGICLALVTTGSEVSFDCHVTAALDPAHPLYSEVMEHLGSLGQAEDGLIDGIDAVVEGGQSHTVAVRDGRIAVRFDNPEHLPLEVRIYLPLIMSVAVGRLVSNGTAAPAPRRGYLLALGDSITQGFVVGCPSLSYPALLSAELGLDLVNQAVCGYVFDQKTLTGIKALRKEPPAAITVAYGTNDWGCEGSGKEIRRDASAYLDRLCKLFPNTPIYVLTPLWRADEADEATLAGIPNGKSLSWVRRAIERACRGHENVTVVDGASILPRSPLMFADGRLHPGSTGAGIVAEALAAAVRNGGGVGVGGRGPQADPVSAPVPGPEVATTADALCAVDAESLSRPGVPGTHCEFDRLVRTVWRLRQEDGCPWDREQTHKSLVRYMVEEAYEAAEALRADDASHMAEELGDVLYQVVLNSQVAAEEGAFTIDDVCRAIDEKLVRRHPHVFGGVDAETPEDVARIWDNVKRRERETAGASAREPEVGLLDSVPRAMPALMQCQKISARAAKVGFDWDDVSGVWDKVHEERDEFEREPTGSQARALEFGDLLFSLVNVARMEGIDAEGALAQSNEKFRRRWSRMEDLAREKGCDLDALSTAELNELWDRAKQEESHS